jgi:hypothetical protein
MWSKYKYKICCMGLESLHLQAFNAFLSLRIFSTISFFFLLNSTLHHLQYKLIFHFIQQVIFIKISTPAKINILKIFFFFLNLPLPKFPALKNEPSKKYAEKFALLFSACTHTLIHFYFFTNYRPFHKEPIDTDKLLWGVMAPTGHLQLRHSKDLIKLI